MIMTGEVGRLQKERQALEQQIGDLFTFYAKQKSLTAGLVRRKVGILWFYDH